ncbi:class I ribonucleotide reductase maintenance protein YfaE [Algibacillus agarilyticus]|uniref:class I ribonucleotide reductase maintenance protein YfaE n=1 Tax=Algibacillus agarilyticus TaxID=2234133 RepID=UPI000DCFA627|nr:class I ribonucleotide reductase maintenance protein YfaE [Algibacillus agarilyticus]
MSDEIEFTLVMDDFNDSKKTNILEYLEQQELNVHYHCRDGFCGACRTPLVSGDIHYHKEPLAFIRSGEFLPCCSTPKTNLKITAKQNSK